MAKFYCVYLAYAKYEIIDSSAEEYKDLPMYPRSFARVRIYNNKTDQMNAYANTPCPASQLFETDTKEEIDTKVKEFNENFENEEWLKKNIYPYL